VLEHKLSEQGGERVDRLQWDATSPSWSAGDGKSRREQFLCLKVVLVSSSPEHLPNGTMTKGIRRKRQQRENDGERGDIWQG